MKCIALGLVTLLVCGCRSDTHGDDRPLAGSARTTSTSGTSAADTRLASEVQRAIANDTALSYDARNVSVSARGGQVTLRGKVSSAEEKRRVEDIARRCAGVSSVNNELDVRV